jgi:hypothetical protein
MPAPFPVVRARLDSALAARDLARIRAAAREMPSVVTLTDAVKVLLLMEEVEDPAFEAAAVRWIARLTTECRGLTLASVHAAVEALDALPTSDATATLLSLINRHSSA